MTSTEPLRAIVVNEVPLWDAKVRSILVELRGWLTATNEAPIIKRNAIHNLHEQLDLLLYQLEEGKWPEGVLAPKRPELEEWPRQEQKSTWELAAEEFDRRALERLDWIPQDYPANR